MSKQSPVGKAVYPHTSYRNVKKNGTGTPYPHKNTTIPLSEVEKRLKELRAQNLEKRIRAIHNKGGRRTHRAHKNKKRVNKSRRHRR